MSATTLERDLRLLVAADGLDLPGYGSGETYQRLERLAAIAARDLPLARLAEAHLDAVTILADADRTPRPGALYGVWASGQGTQQLTLHGDAADALVLSGEKGFCTGAHIVDRALVTARHDGDIALVEIDARNPAISFGAGGWRTEAFAGTNTYTAEIDRLEVGVGSTIGDDGWYLRRTGFWHGALAPAACWVGGAIGLVDHCLQLGADRELTPHQLAHLGELDAIRWQLEADLHHAARVVDQRQTTHDDAMRLAYRCRANVERMADDAIHHALRAYGPRLLVNDQWAAQRVAEVQLYIRQHHAEADLEQLGLLVTGAGGSTTIG